MYTAADPFHNWCHLPACPVIKVWTSKRNDWDASIICRQPKSSQVYKRLG